MLIVYAAAVILVTAKPFVDSLVETGLELGIDEFILIQWIAPLASESPEIIIAILFSPNFQRIRYKTDVLLSTSHCWDAGARFRQWPYLHYRHERRRCQDVYCLLLQIRLATKSTEVRPSEGEQFKYGDLKVEVTRMRGTKIETIKLTTTRKSK